MANRVIVRYSDWYCHALHMFSPEPHKASCCETCCVQVPEDLYKQDAWYPQKREQKTYIVFTLNGDDWHDFDKGPV